MQIKSCIVFTICIILSQTCHTMSPQNAAKDFVFKKLDPITHYQLFTQGKIRNNSVLNLIFQLAEKHQTTEEIFKAIITKGPYISYQQQKISIQKSKDLLTDTITGFINAVKNQLEMFYRLQQALLVVPKKEQPSQTNINLDQLELPEDWKPEPIQNLIITQDMITWAQEELVVELNYYIMNFITEMEDKKTTWQMFKTWLKELDQTMIQNNFAPWINHLVNPNTANRLANSTTEFSLDTIIFFIEQYIPQIILSQNPQQSKTTWNGIKNIFPGFAIYDDKKLFGYINNDMTKHTVQFLVQIINTNLAKMAQESRK